MFSFDTMQVLVYLTPGIIAGLLNRSITIRGKKYSDLTLLIESLIFSILIYTVSSFIPGLKPLNFDPTTKLLNPDLFSFAILLLISIIFAIVYSVLNNKDLMHFVLRKARITKNTSRPSVWNDAFSDFDVDVVVTLNDGSRIYGHPLYYSDDSEKPYLFLENPHWVFYNKEIDKDEFVNIGDLNGLLITPESKILTIAFYKIKS